MGTKKRCDNWLFQVPLLYLINYQRIKEKCKGSKIIRTNVLLEVIRRQNPKAPKRFDYVIIKELEKMCLLRKIDKQKYEVLGGNRDLELAKYTYPLWG
jgi:hypothetical protein